MSYIDLINQFWQKDLEFSFNADEVNLYFRLLKHANLLHWQKPRFNIAVDKLMLEVGIKTKRPFDTARKSLRDAGLIDFVNGNGRGCTTEYRIIGAEIPTERGAKNTPLSATFPQGFREENVPVHKSKIKSKTKEATASASADEVEIKSPTERGAKNTPLSAEPWAAWLAEHTPTVQRLKSPLTADQYAKLTADFGEPMVREVLASMENHAGLLKKYTSANLTARDWCKRRCPNGKPPAPPPTAGQPVSLTLELNEEFEAEQRARDQAEAAERGRQFRATYANPDTP